MRALALFSGGLDSLLAIKIIKDLGVEVIALHFNIGFGGKGEIGLREKELQARLDQVGVRLCLLDIREQFFSSVLFSPKYGYGKYFNPCIDCHANMFAHALAALPYFGASFVISGEVLGQRPKSQRAEALNQVLSLASSRAFSLVDSIKNALIESSLIESSLIESSLIESSLIESSLIESSLIESGGADSIKNTDSIKSIDSIKSSAKLELKTPKIEEYFKNLGAENGDLSGLILRPMSAKLLEPSIPELRGWVERERLLGISGRDRSAQLEMVARFGISDYERPGGGCLLTDTTLSERIKDFSSHRAKLQNKLDSIESKFNIESKNADSIKFGSIESKFDIESKSQNAAKNFNFLDIAVLKYGRYFVLNNGARFIISRNEEENKMLSKLFAIKFSNNINLDSIKNVNNSIFIAMEIINAKGGLGFLEKTASAADLALAARLLLVYAKTQENISYKIRLCAPQFLSYFFEKDSIESDGKYDIESNIKSSADFARKIDFNKAKIDKDSIDSDINKADSIKINSIDSDINKVDSIKLDSIDFDIFNSNIKEPHFVEISAFPFSSRENAARFLLQNQK